MNTRLPDRIDKGNKISTQV